MTQNMDDNDQYPSWWDERAVRENKAQWNDGAEQYIDMIHRVQEAFTDDVGLPPAITTDIICGFPGETEADHEQTLSLLEEVTPAGGSKRQPFSSRRFLAPSLSPRAHPTPIQVRFDKAFMFAYSMREKTHAHRSLSDDVDEPTKQRRLREVIELFNQGAREANQEQVGRVHLLLVDGPSKKSPTEWVGRTDCNRRAPCDTAEMRSQIRPRCDRRP